MRLTHPQKGPRCLPRCHRAPAFVISQSGFLMALPAAGSSQGSDMPTPPPRWCGAGGPHTGGSRDGRGLSGTEGQADGSTTKRFMRLDQGPPSPRQRWGRGHRWRRAERTPAAGPGGGEGRGLKATGGAARSQGGDRGQRGEPTRTPRLLLRASPRARLAGSCWADAGAPGRGQSASLARTDSRTPLLWACPQELAASLPLF